MYAYGDSINPLEESINIIVQFIKEFINYLSQNVKANNSKINKSRFFSGKKITIGHLF